MDFYPEVQLVFFGVLIQHEILLPSPRCSWQRWLLGESTSPPALVKRPLCPLFLVSHFSHFETYQREGEPIPSRRLCFQATCEVQKQPVGAAVCSGGSEVQPRSTAIVTWTSATVTVMCPLVTDLYHCTPLVQGPPRGGERLPPFHGCVIFHCLAGSHSVYPLTCQWTFVVVSNFDAGNCAAADMCAQVSDSCHRSFWGVDIGLRP